MLSTYTYPKFEYRTPPELNGKPKQRHPVVVIGAGPVGLATAIDLAQQGLQVILLDDDDSVSVGSRGVCYAKRTLEVLDRLGCGQALVDKGVTWNVGRTFFDTEEVFNFDLLPDAGHERPGMINLQQYYMEEFLVKRATQLAAIDIRWKHKVSKIEPSKDGVIVFIDTPDGSFSIDADWLVVADGARSPVRRQLGLEIDGKVFQDRFLIADVVMKADFPAERWFWFDPPFHRNQSVLLHRQADSVWRIDFQLGWDADPEEEKKPENVIPRIRAMLGDEREFELEWVSVYTFQCRRMQKFRHGRILFAGDSAHQVSPFGARGGNSGIQDADNLGWKLRAVVEGIASERLLDSYSDERGYAADENLQNSTRSTDFITPKSSTSKIFRNAVLDLAREHAFARSLVNSGRLSVPAFLTESQLNTSDTDPFEGWMMPGAPMDDAPVQVNGLDTWLLRQVSNASHEFTLLIFGTNAIDLPELPWKVRVLRVIQRDGLSNPGDVVDTEGLVARRYDGRSGTVYLLRPDQHVAARWRNFDATALRNALSKALCLI
jgi:3-(3-hydroxy-phenyl)propionate hydroxylase